MSLARDTAHHVRRELWFHPDAVDRMKAVIARIAPDNRAPLPLTIEETTYHDTHFNEELIRRIHAGETVWYVDIHIRTNPPNDTEPSLGAIPGQHDFSVTGTGPTKGDALSNAHRYLNRQATILIKGGSPIDPMYSRAAHAARGTH